MKNILKLISEGKTDEALGLLEDYIKKNPSSDEAYFLLGNIFRKKEDFKNALNNYLKAMELNPDSPAKIAHDQIIKILNFYNKELYNP